MANQLFATLDPTARRCFIDDGNEVILSDTVGFIRGLPHQLIDAFKSTLDEASQADLLLHVVDASSPVLEDQMAEVDKVLKEIGAGDLPQIRVYNKIDLLDREPFLTLGNNDEPIAVGISATKGEGLDLLRKAIAYYAEKKKFSTQAIEEDFDEEWLKEFEP